MTSTISFSNVSKRYQLGLTRTSFPSMMSSLLKKTLNRTPATPTDREELWALQNVSFELERGDSLALVGSNGAGKTTILKLLANITQPTSGRITTRGQLSALIELGAGFHPDLTGRENIFLNGTILGLSRKEISSRFDEIVDFSEIERFIDTPVKRYSSGMIVRLGFAVASSIQPEIILVDEVLAVGDAAFQQKCLKRIRELVQQDTSIVFVSHNFYLVQAVCKSALYLEKGQVKHFGPTKEIIDLYEQDLHMARARKFEGKQEEEASGDGDIEVTGVEISQEDGSVPEIFKSDRPAKIDIHYNAYQPLGQIQASVFLIRSDGLTCSMIRTKLDQFDFHVDKGQGTISLTIKPLQLVTGSYYAEAWFLNQSDSMAITTKGGRTDWFMVKGAALSYEESSGIYEANSEWRHAHSSGVEKLPISLNGPG